MHGPPPRLCLSRTERGERSARTFEEFRILEGGGAERTQGLSTFPQEVGSRYLAGQKSIRDFGMQLSGLGFRDSGFQSRDLGISGFGSRGSGFGFPVSGFGIRVLWFGIRGDLRVELVHLLFGFPLLVLQPRLRHTDNQIKSKPELAEWIHRLKSKLVEPIKQLSRSCSRSL